MGQAVIPIPAGLYTYAATAIVAAALGATGAWKVQGWRAGALEKERVEAVAEQRRMNQRAADQAAEGFEDDKAKTEDRARTIVKWRDKIIDRPVYRNLCMDADGLRLLNDSLRRIDPAGEPGLKLPRPANTR